jgi:hypothetical protein
MLAQHDRTEQNGIQDSAVHISPMQPSRMLGPNSAHLKRVQLQQAHAALHKQMVECVRGCQEGLIACPQNHADRAQLSSLAVGLAHVGQYL